MYLTSSRNDLTARNHLILTCVIAGIYLPVTVIPTRISLASNIISLSFLLNPFLLLTLSSHSFR